MQVLGHRDFGHVAPSPAFLSPRGERPETLAAPETTASTNSAVTPEIEALVARLAVVSDVRPDRVSEVAGRLDQGTYLTREAAQCAAAVILDS